MKKLKNSNGFKTQLKLWENSEMKLGENLNYEKEEKMKKKNYIVKNAKLKLWQNSTQKNIYDKTQRRDKTQTLKWQN